MNQVLWNEGDEANGMYLLLSGSVKYQKTVDYETPIEAKSSNKWFRESIQQTHQPQNLIKRRCDL